jgi:hypothetical protein
MKKPILKSMVVCAVVLFAGFTIGRAQSKPENLFNPPSWILGEWANLGQTNADNIERLVFSANEIELKQGLADMLIQFSRKFKKYTVKETFEDPETYRIIISKDKEEYVYEFKLCPREQCYITSGDALTYSISKNKKNLRMHSTSMQDVLIRRNH